MKILQFPGYLTGFSSRADGSAGLRFTTQELNPNDFADLQAMNGEFGTLYFRPNDIQEIEIKDEDAEEGKKPSQRLRASLYRLWEQEGRVGTAENHYREHMEKLIAHVKNKLD